MVWLYFSVFRIRSQSGQWIRIRIWNPDRDQEDKIVFFKISFFEVLDVSFEGWRAKAFTIFGHQNPESGSVFSLKFWIRIRTQWIRIRNTDISTVCKFVALIYLNNAYLLNSNSLEQRFSLRFAWPLLNGLWATSCCCCCCCCCCCWCCCWVLTSVCTRVLSQSTTDTDNAGRGGGGRDIRRLLLLS